MIRNARGVMIPLFLCLYSLLRDVEKMYPILLCLDSRQFGIFEQRIVNRESSRESLFVGQQHRRKAFGNSSQSQTLSRHLFLALHIGRTHDKCKPSQSRRIQTVVVNDGLKTAPLPTMIQFDLGDSWCVERNCLFGGSCSQKLIFVHKEKLRIWIDETSHQPRTRNSIDFDVLAGDPFQRRLRDSAFNATANRPGT